METELNNIDILEKKLIQAVGRDSSADVTRAVQNLKINGGDIKKVDKPDKPLLYFAVRTGQVGPVSLLIKEGCDPNAVYLERYSSMALAVEMNKLSILRVLLSHGGDPNTKEDGRPILFKAIYNMGYPLDNSESNEMAFQLLSFGADVNAKDDKGMPCLSFLVCNTNDEFSLFDDLFRKGAMVNEKDREGMTALMHAAKNGKIEYAKRLLCNDADIEERDYTGHTAIFFAVISKNFEMFMFLAERRARLDAVINNGCSLLAIAAWNRFGHLPRDAAYENSKKIAEHLIKKGVDVNKKNKNDQTALHCAAENNDVPMCELLVENGALIDELDSCNLTPLGCAIFHECPDSAKYLLSKGARFDTKDNFNRTPLEHAREKEMHEIVKMMELLKMEDGSKWTGNPTKKTKTDGCDVQ